MPALDLDLDEIKDMFEINVFAVMMVTKAFASLLIEAEGKIVMIGSLAGVMPYAFGSAYGASKAALHSYTNTLRVEMKPFGVQVINIVTGGVATQLARVDRQLPSDSYYNPIKEFFAKRVQYSQRNSIPAPVYAKSVVAHVIRSYPSPWAYHGYFAWRAWFLDTFFPKWIFDGFMSAQFGLNKLKKIWDDKRKQA
ncbi:hypothetical protein AA313_de0206475 [Arthrobotrys entomopaga]|nr:hypothetical protein AA313_de0206475 [Arthrobotrys entomopaga]